MNLSNIVPGFPHSFWEGILELGKTEDWLHMEKWDGRQTGFRLNRSKFSQLHQQQIIRLLDLANQSSGEDNGGVHFLWIEAMGRLAADGPKMFRPTFEQCEAMEQVRLTIPIRDYTQPYPAMIIEFPEEYIRLIAERTNYVDTIFPRHIIVRWHTNPYYAFFAGAVMRSTHTDVDQSYFFQEREDFPTIEDALQFHVQGEGPGENLVEIMTRVSMNLMMMLCNAPSGVVLPPRPTNQSHYEKLVHRLRKRPDLESNKVEAATYIHEVCLSQEIVVRGRDVTPKQRAEGTHASPHPHWRKGHWRRQRCGTGRQDTKMVFIRPVFVRGIGVEMSQTSVLYKC